MQHGYGKLWLPDGQQKEGIFENNVFIGVNNNQEDPLQASPIKKEQAKVTLKEDKIEGMGFANQKQMSVNLNPRLNKKNE